MAFKILFLPRFLSLLEEEVYGTSSPIWDVDFSQNPANLPLSPTSGNKFHVQVVNIKKIDKFQKLLS